MTDLLDFTLELGSKPDCGATLLIIAPDGKYTRACQAEQHPADHGHTTYFRGHQILLPAGETSTAVNIHPTQK